MPNPRGRKAKKNLIGGKVLEPANMTQVAAGDETNSAKNDNLLNVALYSNYGATPTIENASTTLLSDAVSDSDGNFSNAGGSQAPWASNQNGIKTGETSDLEPLGTGKSLYHYSFPRIRGAQTVISQSSGDAVIGVGDTVIIYTADGPQSNYVNFYFTGSFDDANNFQPANVGTASIKFGVDITGSAGLPHAGAGTAGTYKYLNIYAAGTLYSSGDPLTSDMIVVSSAAGQKYFRGSGSFNSGTMTLSTASIIKGSTYGGLEIYFSSSADTDSTGYAGAFVYISASNTTLDSGWGELG